MSRFCCREHAGIWVEVRHEAVRYVQSSLSMIARHLSSTSLVTGHRKMFQHLVESRRANASHWIPAGHRGPLCAWYRAGRLPGTMPGFSSAALRFSLGDVCGDVVG